MNAADLDDLRKHPATSPLLPRQEPGRRRSAPLPYELTAIGRYDSDHRRFAICMEARKNRFGHRAAGAPFIVYAIQPSGDFSVRNYAVGAGQTLEDFWDVAGFANEQYHFRVDGPNRFWREFYGVAAPTGLVIQVFDEPSSTTSKALSGNVGITVFNDHHSQVHTVEIIDRSYQTATQRSVIASRSQLTIVVDTQSSSRWYDVGVAVLGDSQIFHHYSGRVETCAWGMSDPALDGLT